MWNPLSNVIFRIHSIPFHVYPEMDETCSPKIIPNLSLQIESYILMVNRVVKSTVKKPIIIEYIAQIIVSSCPLNRLEFPIGSILIRMALYSLKNRIVF